MTEGKIEHELKLLNNRISNIELNPKIIDGWLLEKYVKKFFDYSDTAMAELLKTKELLVSEIGRRRFYKVDSIITLLNKHIVTK